MIPRRHLARRREESLYALVARPESEILMAQGFDSADALGESRSVLATHYDRRDVTVEKVLGAHSTHIFAASERGKFVLSFRAGRRPPFLYQFAPVPALRHQRRLLVPLIFVTLYIHIPEGIRAAAAPSHGRSIDRSNKSLTPAPVENRRQQSPPNWRE